MSLWTIPFLFEFLESFHIFAKFSKLSIFQFFMFFSVSFFWFFWLLYMLSFDVPHVSHLFLNFSFELFEILIVFLLFLAFFDLNFGQKNLIPSHLLYVLNGFLIIIANFFNCFLFVFSLTYIRSVIYWVFLIFAAFFLYVLYKPT